MSVGVPQGFVQLLTVGRPKESALMGRLGALLYPTWQSYAGLPPGEGACVTFYALGDVKNFVFLD